MEQRQAPQMSGAAFPTDPEQFDSDERISFSKLDKKFILVQDDGTEFEFDDAIRRWIPVLDEALLEEQQKAYRVAGVDESEPVEAMKRKRKKEYVNGEDVSPSLPLSPLLASLKHIANKAFLTSRKVVVWSKQPRKQRLLSPREPTRPST
jgi:HIV Tat-specific factor 1